MSTGDIKSMVTSFCAQCPNCIGVGGCLTKRVDSVGAVQGESLVKLNGHVDNFILIHSNPCECSKMNLLVNGMSNVYVSLVTGFYLVSGHRLYGTIGIDGQFRYHMFTSQSEFNDKRTWSTGFLADCLSLKKLHEMLVHEKLVPEMIETKDALEQMLRKHLEMTGRVFKL